MPIINTVIAGGGSPAPTPALYREFQLDADGALQPNTTTTHIMDFTGVKVVSDYALYRAYYLNTAISGVVDMSDLRHIEDHGCHGTFNGCTGITSANLSSVTIIGGSLGCAMTDMFRDCSNLVSADLSSLVRAPASSTIYTPLSSTFRNCGMLTNIRLDSLKELGKVGMSNTFAQCQSLSDVKFPAFTGSTFGGAGALNNIFNGINGITVHFPNNIQAAVEGLTGYSTTAPFGATSGAVLFDLPSTAHLMGANSVEYERNPKYDTASSLGWRVKDTNTQQVSGIDFTPYYTSGTSDPTVGTTIYSDSACTTSVTTVSSIA